MDKAKNYYRIMLGKKSKYADECFKDGFIGGNWGLDIDLTRRLPENWRMFNKEFIPIYLEKHPDKSKIAAGLACGMLHTICKGMQIGDIILGPTGDGGYRAGEVMSKYFLYR